MLCDSCEQISAFLYYIRHCQTLGVHVCFLMSKEMQCEACYEAA
jgi:hypothetical protein